MIKKTVLENVINKAIQNGADFCEIFAENKTRNDYALDTGKINKVSNSTEFGAGIRVALGSKYVYGYTNDISEANLAKIAYDLASTFNAKPNEFNVELKEETLDQAHAPQIMHEEVDVKKKVEIMHFAYETAKAYDKSISQVQVILWDEDQKVLIANSEGKLVRDNRVRTRLLIDTVAANDETMQTGYESVGGQSGYEMYTKEKIEYAAKEAARIAVTMLNADECMSGDMTVVLNNGFGGVIFHEACGHPLEATSVAKGLSVFCDKLGTKVASDVVTAIDDATITNGWGSGNIDDEGNKTEKNVLIKDGILQKYLVDKLNGKKMNTPANGVSRRQSYKLAPTSRMSNTYIDNGKSTFDEIIKATDKGIFAKRLGGGSVDPSTGDFNFAVMEGYLIENGKITTPIRGATLVGNGAEVLHKIDMVANNLDFARGMCGSVSGSIPADVGQPTLRVSSITVGGRKGSE